MSHINTCINVFKTRGLRRFTTDSQNLMTSIFVSVSVCMCVLVHICLLRSYEYCVVVRNNPVKATLCIRRYTLWRSLCYHSFECLTRSWDLRILHINLGICLRTTG